MPAFNPRLRRDKPVREINVDLDAKAERFVIFINEGKRTTPTLVIGEGKQKTIISEPTNAELDELSTCAGYPSQK
jgi:glutaredoxin